MSNLCDTDLVSVDIDDDMVLVRIDPIDLHDRRDLTSILIEVAQALMEVAHNQAVRDRWK